MRRPLRAHARALGAALVALIAVGAAWIAYTRGYPPSGLNLNGPMGLVMLVGLAALWFVVRAILEHRVQWRLVTVLVTSLAFAVAPMVLACGPVACFTPEPNQFMGWFVAGGVVLAAVVHHLMLSRHPAEPR